MNEHTEHLDLEARWSLVAFLLLSVLGTAAVVVSLVLHDFGTDPVQQDLGVLLSHLAFGVFGVVAATTTARFLRGDFVAYRFGCDER